MGIGCHSDLNWYYLILSTFNLYKNDFFEIIKEYHLSFKNQSLILTLKYFQNLSLNPWYAKTACHSVGVLTIKVSQFLSIIFKK